MQLTPNRMVQIFDAWATTMIENKDYLIKLDGIAGDGDLGLAMMDGFNAVQASQHGQQYNDIGTLLYNAGKTMSIYAPSSLGTLIAFGFMQAGKELKGKSVLNESDICLLHEAFEKGIIMRGKAKLGEKTFLDGFDPAVQELKKYKDGEDFKIVLRKAAVSAQHGAMSTVGMLAKHGRIAVRGEDSRQILDPGAVVASLLVTTLVNTLETFD